MPDVRTTTPLNPEEHVGRWYVCEKCDHLAEYPMAVKCEACGSDYCRKWRVQDMLGVVHVKLAAKAMLAALETMLQLEDGVHKGLTTLKASHAAHAAIAQAREAEL